MALKNPLAYYTPGIPGRGAGTILKQPDLTGYAARQMKLTDLKLKQKQDEDKKVKDDIADLMNLKGTIDTEIREEGKNKVDYFFNEAQKEISKVNGNWGEADMSRLMRLKWETENYLAQGTLIGKEHDETSKKWVAMEASGLYDDDILAEQKQYIIDESKKPLMERNYPAILSISKLYDFDKKTSEKIKGIGVFQDGRISKPALNDETGLYVSTGTKVSGVSTPEVMEQIKSSMITDPKYAKNFAANFDKMKGKTVNYRYVNYNKTSGNVDVEQKQVTITTPEQYMEFEAGKRSYAKYTPVVNAQSKSGGGNINVTVSGSGVPQKTNIAASAPVSMPYGNVTVYGQKVDANKVIDEKSQLTFTPSKEAYTVEGDTPSAGIVQGGSAMIYPIAAKDIKWSTGAVSKKGTILARPEYWSEVDYNSWMDKNKNLYSYSPYILLYNTSAKNTTVDKFSKQESFIKANLGDDYWNEVWRITNEMNGRKPTNTQPQGNTVNPTAKKPSYPQWKKNNPNGTYQQWSSL